MEELDASARLLLELSHAGDLKAKGVLHRGCGHPGLEIPTRDAEGREFVEREVDPSAVPSQARVNDGPADPVLGVAAGEVIEEPLAPANEPFALLGIGEGRTQVIDNLVGISRKAVKGMDVRSLPRGQQQGGEVIGLAVGGIELPAALIGRSQEGIVNTGRVKVS